MPFSDDQSPNAYEKVVDRLLASPRYGERMAAPWLAAARYADTNGYQTDAERYMWRWRDWVIDAFNRNMPFDEFTVEQIALNIYAARRDPRLKKSPAALIATTAVTAKAASLQKSTPLIMFCTAWKRPQPSGSASRWAVRAATIFSTIRSRRESSTSSSLISITSRKRRKAKV